MRLPFGIGAQKPHHYLEMARIAWENRNHPAYAMKVLSQGVCDGCALGTTGLKDWTIEGTHLCLIRLNLLRLNTMDALDETALADVSELKTLDSKTLRDLGRLPFPMVRVQGERGFKRVEWDEANTRIGRRLGSSPPSRQALFLTSRGITNEVYYVAQKAWRALGSPHIENAARLCHSPSTVAMKTTMGISASTCSYRDFMEAEAIFFFGSNPANDQPVVMKYLHEARLKGAKVYAVNPFEEPGMKRYWVPSTPSSALFGTDVVDRFFGVRTGGDLAFLCAVKRTLIETGGVDRAFVDAHVAGFEELSAHLQTLSVPQLLADSGASAEDLEAFVRILRETRRGIFVWSMGLTQNGHGAETVGALCNLGLLRGYVGRDGAGLMPIRGHSGVQGGAEMGAYATVLPGGLPVSDKAVRARFSEAWGFPIPEGPGLHTVGMIEAALRGELDVLYAMGGNFLETLPQPARVEAALSSVPLRIHQDIVLTKQMLVPAREEVWLLPARTRYEQEGGGTETTTERRVVYSPHIPGHDIGQARTEWRIVLDLVRAARPDLSSELTFEDADAIRREIESLVPAYAGIASLKRAGDAFQSGGRHLCADGQFPLPDFKARLWCVSPPQAKIGASELRLSTRRGKQFNSMVHAEVDGLTGARRDDILMAASDVLERGLREGERVRVISDFGELEATVKIVAMMPGNAQMHWPEANCLLPAERLDPLSGVPDYNAHVRVISAS